MPVFGFGILLMDRDPEMSIKPYTQAQHAADRLGHAEREWSMSPESAANQRWRVTANLTTSARLLKGLLSTSHLQ